MDENTIRSFYKAMDEAMGMRSVDPLAEAQKDFEASRSTRLPASRAGGPRLMITEELKQALADPKNFRPGSVTVAAQINLSDEDVDRIAERVASLLTDRLGSLITNALMIKAGFNEALGTDRTTGGSAVGGAGPDGGGSQVER